MCWNASPDQRFSEIFLLKALRYLDPVRTKGDNDAERSFVIPRDAWADSGP